ncbi:type II secretion system protein GspH [Limnohabitans sp. Jir61]|uniref:prepilin-type N-terminal cleavage/methylation domain-containing protein n=1 Tax=Limnohabitans sp. Jir61 TaxID=1826168 RepID=UPI000D3B477E|nr:prepilin-type N-terminal cleavage/methylation domain-containing protein [Limnohabitans sp. Jir61]PUE31118.1 type II secretion system protein GspH [Limnohabitans sp. Jir61]
MQRQRGLTLLELLVVLAIIGFAMAGVSLSLRNSSQTQLEQEAQRLVAILEAARAQSRTSGVALLWQATPEGFVIRPASGNPNSPIAARTETWSTTGTQATVNTTTPSANNATPANLVVLGPEPMLAPTRITLSMATASNTKPAPSLTIGTDGLKPFQVLP